MEIENLDPASTPESETAPVDTRSIIEAAVARQREAPVEAAEAPEPEKAADVPAPAEGEPAARARDEKGRFAPKDGEAEAAPVIEDPKAEQEPAKEPEDSKPVVRPPPGWSPASKADFDKLPEHVRNDIAKRETEVNNGFAKLAEYKPLERYVEQARQSGTTLDKALERYTAMEATLSRDPVAGFEAISRNMGIDPVVFAQHLVARYGGSTQTGASGAVQQTGYQQPQIDPNAIIQRAKAEIQAEFEQRETQTAIQAFQADPANRFFENVRSDMAALLSAGKATSLKDAYEMACWMNPETRAILVREQAASQAPKPATQALQQAKQAAKAVGGAPSPGFNPGADKAASNLPLRETIQRAIAAQR